MLKRPNPNAHAAPASEVVGSAAFGPNFKRMKFADEPGSNLLERITDEHTLSQRQKQIDFGKNTLAYDRYAKEVLRSERAQKDPWTPQASEPISKRRFAGKLQAWRRQLHDWEEAHPLAVPAVASSGSTGSSAAVCAIGAPPQQPQQQGSAPAPVTTASIGARAGLLSCADNFDDFLDGELGDDDDEDEGTHEPVDEAKAEAELAALPVTDLPAKLAHPVTSAPSFTTATDPSGLRKRLDEFKTQPPVSQHSEQPAKPKVASIFGAFDDDLLG